MEKFNIPVHSIRIPTEKEVPFSRRYLFDREDQVNVIQKAFG